MALMETPDTLRGDTAREIAERLVRISGISHAIHGAASIAQLFALTADSVCDQLDFCRAIVLGLDDGHLDAALAGQAQRPANDRLRRRILAAPIALRRGTEEHAIVRLGNGFRRERPTEESALVEVLGTDRFVIVPVVAESRTTAVLVADRAGREVDDADVAGVQLVADLVAHELGRLVQRLRVDVLLDEVRHSSASLLALGREAQQGSVVLPRDHGLGPTFPRMDVSTTRTSGTEATKLLSEGELRVTRLLVEGRSNREIAEALTLSPETVKTYVTRILRKLGAANRAEAVSVFLRLTEQG